MLPLKLNYLGGVRVRLAYSSGFGGGGINIGVITAADGIMIRSLNILVSKD